MVVVKVFGKFFILSIIISHKVPAKRPNTIAMINDAPMLEINLMTLKA